MLTCLLHDTYVPTGHLGPWEIQTYKMALFSLKKRRGEEWGSNPCLDYLAERGGVVRRLSQAKNLLEGRL